MGEKTITTGVVLLVFAVILVIAIMASWTVEPSSFDETHWKVFIVTLSSLSIIITFMFYYAIVELQEMDQETSGSQQVEKLSSRVSEIQSTSFPKYFKIVPNFVTSLLGDPCEEDEDNDWEMKIASNGLAFEVFSVWELSVNDEFINGAHYTVLFESWAKSKYLKEEWLRQRCFFGDDTREYGDSLFEL